MNKKWEILYKEKTDDSSATPEEIVKIVLDNRGIITEEEKKQFLHPVDPYTFSSADVDIDKKELARALTRITKAIDTKESVVVYADYDADGITSGTIMWETLHALGANVMPYIPHRVEEGYGLSVKGIDAVKENHNPTLIITVDHGITGVEKVAYAKSLGIDVIVTDHHVKPDVLPDCTIVHTTKLCGAGVSWFVAKELLALYKKPRDSFYDELVALASIGTIADMIPLTGINRTLVKFGLSAINSTRRVGLLALITESGLARGSLGAFDISHVLAPRLNAMGRLVHALDALRLLCTKQEDKAVALAKTLGVTNKERQQLTIDTVTHARDVFVKQRDDAKRLIFLSDSSYNPGVIGLVAGKLVEEFYLPTIILSVGEQFSKASARSIAGFNIVEAIRSCSDLLVDVGGHPMAAGFTVETKNLAALKERLEHVAGSSITDDMLIRVLKADMEIPLANATEAVWFALQELVPFGFGNYEPIFVSRHVTIEEARLIGATGKHLKLRLPDGVEAVAFGFGSFYGTLQPKAVVDLAYSIDMNEWNGSRRLQLKVKDVHVLKNL